MSKIKDYIEQEKRFADLEFGARIEQLEEEQSIEAMMDDDSGMKEPSLDNYQEQSQPW